MCIYSGAGSDSKILSISIFFLSTIKNRKLDDGCHNQHEKTKYEMKPGKNCSYIKYAS